MVYEIPSDRIRVGEPINPGEYSIDTRRELANYVRDKVEALKQ